MPLSADGIVAKLAATRDIADATRDLSRIGGSAAADAAAGLAIVAWLRGAPIEEVISGLERARLGAKYLATESRYFLGLACLERGTEEQLFKYALPAAQELIERYPDNPSFIVLLSKLAHDLGFTEDAKRTLDQALARRALVTVAARAEALFVLGAIASDEDCCVDAAAYFDRVIALEPQYPEYLLPWTFYRAAECQVRLGAFEGASSLILFGLRSRNVNAVHDRLKELRQTIHDIGASGERRRDY
jgi:tetratricopeptide (TPR) repeat protein